MAQLTLTAVTVEGGLRARWPAITGLAVLGATTAARLSPWYRSCWKHIRPVQAWIKIPEPVELVLDDLIGLEAAEIGADS